MTRQDRIGLSRMGKAALLLAGILSPLATGGLGPVLPAIADHFAADPHAEAVSRLLVSCIGMTIVLGSPLAGWLTDRIGMRPVLLAGMIVYAVAGASAFLANNLYLILLSRIFVGLAVAAVGAVMLAVVVIASEGDARNRWLGYVNSIGSLCTLFLIPLAGIIGHFAWRGVFLLHLIALPLFLLAWIGLHPPEAEAAKPHHVDTGPEGRTAHLPASLIVLIGCVGMLAITPAFFLPFRVREIGFGDPALLGFAFLPTISTTVLAGLLYGRVRRFLSLDAVFAVGFAVSALGLIAIALSTDLWGTLFAAAIMGCGNGLLAPNAFARAAMIGTDSTRGRIMGFAKGWLYLGPIIGQTLLEPLVRLGGPAQAFFTLGGVALVLLALFARRGLVSLHRSL